MADKLTRKELKQPDAFQAAGAQAQSWFQERQKAILIVLGVILVGGLGVALATYLSNRSDQQAAKSFGDALKPLSREVAAGESAPVVAEGEDPPFKSQKEKDEALVKALAEFKQQNSGSKAAATAAITLAQANFRLGKLDDALAGFDDYLKAAPTDDPLRAAALEGKGYVFEAKGDYDKALTAFEQLGRENKTEFLTGMGPYHRARVLLAQGKKDEAAKEFSSIAQQFPNTAAARMSQERLSSLVAAGVTPPIPQPMVAADAGK